MQYSVKYSLLTPSSSHSGGSSEMVMVVSSGLFVVESGGFPVLLTFSVKSAGFSVVAAFMVEFSFVSLVKSSGFSVLVKPLVDSSDLPVTVMFLAEYRKVAVVVESCRLLLSVTFLVKSTGLPVVETVLVAVVVVVDSLG